MLLKVAMPLLEVYGKSYETIHAILHLTVIAWNLSIVQDATEKEILQHIMGIFPKEYYTRDIAALIDNIQMLKNRKMELFHDIQEVITKIELRQTEAGYDLTAYGAPVGALRRHSADAAAD